MIFRSCLRELGFDQGVHGLRLRGASCRVIIAAGLPFEVGCDFVKQYVDRLH